MYIWAIVWLWWAWNAHAHGGAYDATYRVYGWLVVSAALCCLRDGRFRLNHNMSIPATVLGAWHLVQREGPLGQRSYGIKIGFVIWGRWGPLFENLWLWKKLFFEHFPKFLSFATQKFWIGAPPQGHSLYPFFDFQSRDAHHLYWRCTRVTTDNFSHQYCCLDASGTFLISGDRRPWEMHPFDSDHSECNVIIAVRVLQKLNLRQIFWTKCWLFIIQTWQCSCIIIINRFCGFSIWCHVTFVNCSWRMCYWFVMYVLTDSLLLIWCIIYNPSMHPSLFVQ